MPGVEICICRVNNCLVCDYLGLIILCMISDYLVYRAI